MTITGSPQSADQVVKPAPPLWLILLSASLVAFAIMRHSSSPAAVKDRPLPEGARNNSTEYDRSRGRSATKPSEIPAKGWKDILLRVYHRLTEDRILLIAAGVTFYLILAIFPGTTALVSVYGLFVNPNTMVSHLDIIASIAPAGAIEVLRDQLIRLGQQNGAALGISFLVSIAISLWTATSGIKAIFDGLNVAYGEVEKRSFIKLSAIALVFTIGTIAFVLLLLAAVVVLPIALRYIPLPGLTSLGLQVARWPILFVVTVFALSIFYRYGPSRVEPQWRWLTLGSVSAALLWLVASILFSWYVANFGNYNKTYGSLGAVIGFMTWIWLSIIVIQLGAQLNAEIEHQTACQSTEGPSRPLGARGAKMADTIGAAQS
jgi:membrane protein